VEESHDPASSVPVLLAGIATTVVLISQSIDRQYSTVKVAAIDSPGNAGQPVESAVPPPAAPGTTGPDAAG
jgi:hypothetical protein